MSHNHSVCDTENKQLLRSEGLQWNCILIICDIVKLVTEQPPLVDQPQVLQSPHGSTALTIALSCI